MTVTIRRFQQKDIENKVKWINDNRNNQYLHYDLPLEYEKTLAWFEINKDNASRYDGIIEVDGVPVGLIGLLSIDYKNSKAEFYIVLGENDFKGKGIAKSASKKLIEYAFKELGLNRIYLFTEVENTSAQALFEKVGFKKEGILRRDVKNGDKIVDRYVYGLCKDDYYSKDNTNIYQFKPTEISKLKYQINSNHIYIKRDDLIPISFGGNKARKAILFFRDIDNSKSDCVVTYGSSSSNHCRIIANMAASRGLPCYIISPIENMKETNNSKMIDLFGAKTIRCPVSEVRQTIDKYISSLTRQGCNPYFIQGGGHGNIGTQAYVDAFQEIKDFENTAGVYFDYIFHASGTGTTQAGLICGNKIYNDTKKIIGISIARKNPHGSQVILESVNNYLKSIGRDTINLADIDFIDEYALDGYGIFNSQIYETIKEVLTSEGIPLDTTYTGKAFWGMKEYIVKNAIEGQKILFVHTGGIPLFFDGLSC